MRYFPHRPAYLPATIATALLFGSILAMSPVAHADEDDELTTIVVTSTRHPRLVGAEPLRVEAVPEIGRAHV